MNKIKITGPGDLAASLPALLGFHPEESLVAVLLKDSAVICTMRVDLPDDLTTFVPDLVRVADNSGSDRVLLALFTDRGHDDLPRRGEVVLTVGLLDAHDLQVADALLLDQGRWWSYLCDDPSCCPPQGTVIPTGTTMLEAERVGAGMPAVAPDRHHLADAYRTRPDLAPSTEAFQAALTVVDQPLTDRCQAGLDAVRALAHRSTGDVDQILRARLILLVRDVNVRDYLLGSIAASDDPAPLTDALVRTALTAPDNLRPPVAAAAAAAVAALGRDPVGLRVLIDLGQEESLAQLVETATSAGFPPEEIRQLLVGCLPVIADRAQSA